MVDVVTTFNSGSMPGALLSQYKFRYQQFIVRKKWSTPTHCKMEYDQFDTPTATYLLHRDAGGSTLGMVRILPTELSYMAENLWPELEPHGGFPKSRYIWENTRFAIEPTLQREVKRKIAYNLIGSSLVLALRHSIKEFIIVSPKSISKIILPSYGVPVEIMSSGVVKSGEYLTLGRIPVSEGLLESIMLKGEIEKKYLLNEPNLESHIKLGHYGSHYNNTSESNMVFS